MSRYEWESGSIKIPSKEYPSLRKEIIQRWNSFQNELFESAQKAFLDIKSSCKGLKKDAMYSKARSMIESGKYGHDYSLSRFIFKYDNFKFTGLKSPKKKDFDIKPLSKGAILHLDDATISLNDKTKTITWDVGENNHARDHARDHVMAKFLFKRLSCVNWTKGSGGVIVGNDEYNSDCDYEGGGANYVTQRFGPLGQKNDTLRNNMGSW